MSEEWKPILDYPDYEVSNLGNVKGKRLLSLTKDKDGYYIVKIKKKRIRVSRLVAMAFIPNPTNLPIVDHIDRNRTNNVVTNLRWVNHTESCLNTNCRDRDLFGIVYLKDRNTYQVRISMNGKIEYFGWRKTLEEAKELRASILG
jgi:hypothetical protein